MNSNTEKKVLYMKDNRQFQNAENGKDWDYLNRKNT